MVTESVQSVLSGDRQAFDSAAELSFFSAVCLSARRDLLSNSTVFFPKTPRWLAWQPCKKVKSSKIRRDLETSIFDFNLTIEKD